jgi:hypothetical protein
MIVVVVALTGAIPKGLGVSGPWGRGGGSAIIMPHLVVTSMIFQCLGC